MSFSGLTLVLFRFRLSTFSKVAVLPFNRSSFFDIQATPQPHVFLPFFPFSFCFFGDVAFSEYFCTIVVFSLYAEYVVLYVISFRMMFFYLVTTGWILTSHNPINQSINQSIQYGQ